MEWWTLALPSWPRWVAELTAAGVVELKQQLTATARGSPNPLIPKSRGRGTVPHFRGRDQVSALERAPMVAVEVYACIACMYSTAALDLAERTENGAEQSS